MISEELLKLLICPQTKALTGEEVELSVVDDGTISSGSYEYPVFTDGIPNLRLPF